LSQNQSESLNILSQNQSENLFIVYQNQSKSLIISEPHKPKLRSLHPVFFFRNPFGSG